MAPALKSLDFRYTRLGSCRDVAGPHRMGDNPRGVAVVEEPSAMLAALRAQWAECERSPGIPQRYYGELRAAAAARQEERDIRLIEAELEGESEVAQRLALVELRARLSADVVAECAALAVGREQERALLQELVRLRCVKATTRAGGACATPGETALQLARARPLLARARAERDVLLGVLASLAPR